MSARNVRGLGAASPTTHAEPLDEMGERFPVIVELVAWVNRLAGGSGSGQLELSEQAYSGDSIRMLLHRVTDVHPRLREVLWDPDTGELGPHVEIVLNGDALGIEHDLDSPVRPGDRITLAGLPIEG